MTIARATVGSQNDFTIDNISVKEVTRDNVPRIDYTGGEDILGSEEVTNGDFVTDLSGWTLSSSTPPVWDNGMMKMQSDGVTFSRADQSFVTEIGVEYKFKINKLVNGDNVQVKIGNGIGNSNVLNQTLSLVGKYTFTITPISTNTTSDFTRRETTWRTPIGRHNAGTVRLRHKTMRIRATINAGTRVILHYLRTFFRVSSR